jgi:hypothetical protein
MWADFLIGLGLAVLLGVGVLAWTRRGGGKNERRRAKAIADATSRRHEPLNADEQEHAEEIHAIVEEYRTGELPKVVEPRRPSVREVARKYRRPGKHAATKLPKSKRFDPLTSPMTVTEKAVMLPATPPVPWELESFTSEWAAGSRAVRELKGARR